LKPDAKEYSMPHLTFIALLRGINVGGQNKLPMAELRTACASLGWEDVQTYIQSGNIAFRSPGEPAVLEASLEAAISQRYGLNIPVIIRPGAEWPAIVAGNPFLAASAVTPNLVMLLLAKRAPLPAALTALQARAAAGEQLAQVGDALWAYFPAGSGRSKLSPALIDRLVGSPVTARNWNTVLKLNELLIK
jgi:uncharacterized protein (DUF1697 family)